MAIAGVPALSNGATHNLARQHIRQSKEISQAQVCGRRAFDPELGGGIMKLAQTLLLGAAMAFTGHAQAQDMTLGEFEYRNSCAVCHGTEGRGDGPLAEYMTVPSPDLTALAANNDGVFPVNRIYEMIEGRARVAPHGLLDMPVWGSRFRLRMGYEDVDFGEEDVEQYVRLRILALIDHLASIQQ